VYKSSLPINLKHKTNTPAPDIIDEKLFEAKYVFKDTEGDLLQTQIEGEINSVDKIMEKKRNR
jgi:hypothetical protein